MKIYISSSWKNRVAVRQMAERLRAEGHEVYDFTDPKCRMVQEIPPELYPEQFDPEVHSYKEYINSMPEYRLAVMENKKAIEWCDAVILMLPCGIDSHADWALGVGYGKKSIVTGQPRKGERMPVHHWANEIVNTIEEVYDWVEKVSR